MRHGDGRLHQPAAERVMDRARPDAHERDPGTAELGREAPSEECERDAQWAGLEVVEDPGPGNDQEVQSTGMSDGADQTGQLARPAPRKPVEDPKQGIGGLSQSDRQCCNSKIARDLICRTVAVSAKADEFRVGSHPPQKGEHRLERAVVARVAAAEQAKEPDSTWLPACHGGRSPARHRRTITGCGGRSCENTGRASPAGRRVRHLASASNCPG